MDAALPFIFAVTALLSVPGPTNSLLAASGALQGVRASLPMVPAEIGGYLAAIGLLSFVAHPLFRALPEMELILKGIAVAYLLWSAVRLWRAPATAASGGSISPRQVFLTTLLNPKAIIFAFVLFPEEPGLSDFSLFSAVLACVSLGWIIIGARLGRVPGLRIQPARIARVTAVVLTLFATATAASAFQGYF